MSALLNGEPLWQAVVVLPQLGPWHADLVLVGDEPPSGRVVLEVLGQTYQGVVVAAGVFAGRATARVVAGAGRLGTLLPAKTYRNPVAVSELVGDVLAEAGEAFSVLVPTTSLITFLPRWWRVAGTAEAALARIAQHLGWRWRLLPDGGLWLGSAQPAPPAPPLEPDQFLEHRPEERLVLVAAEEASWEPGQLLTLPQGDQVVIADVEHRVEEVESRTVLFYESATPSNPISAIVEKVLARLGWAYLTPQRGKVFTQNADGTLQVAMDNRAYGDALQVPLALPPGYTALVKPGTRVLVQWVGADPTQPVAMVEEGECLALTVAADGTTAGRLALNGTSATVGGASIAVGPSATSVGLGPKPVSFVAAMGDPVLPAAIGTPVNVVVKV